MLLFWAVETGVAPGVRVSNWVKFLPFSGRSFTALSEITVPSSLEDPSSITASAFTTMCSLTAPTSSLIVCVTV